MNEHIKEQLETLTQRIKEIAAIYHNIASKAGVSDNEFWIWYTLIILEGEYSQQDICEMWFLPKQTVNTIVTNLTKKGLLYLEAIPGTRNRKVIRTTEEGKKFGESLVSGIVRAEQNSFERMAEAEREACIALTEKYITFLRDEFYE